MGCFSADNSSKSDDSVAALIKKSLSRQWNFDGPRNANTPDLTIGQTCLFQCRERAALKFQSNFTIKFGCNDTYDHLRAPLQLELHLTKS
jgi:hypothetical protein